MKEPAAQPELSVAAPVTVVLLSALLVAGLWGAATHDPDSPAIAPTSAAAAAPPEPSALPVRVQLPIDGDATVDLLGDGAPPVRVDAEPELRFDRPRSEPWLLVVESQGRTVGLTMLPGSEIDTLDQIVVTAESTAAALVGLVPPVLVGDPTEHAERLVSAWSLPAFSELSRSIAGTLSDGQPLLSAGDEASELADLADSAALVAGPGRPVSCPGDAACPRLIADDVAGHSLGAWVAVVDRPSGQVCGWIPPAKAEIDADQLLPTVAEMALTAGRGTVDSDAGLDAAASALAASHDRPPEPRLVRQVDRECDPMMATPNGFEGDELSGELIEAIRGATVVTEVVAPLASLLGGRVVLAVDKEPLSLSGALPSDLTATLAEDPGEAFGSILDVLDSAALVELNAGGTSAARASLVLACSGCEIATGDDEASEGVVEVLDRFAESFAEFAVGPDVSWESTP